MVLLWTTVGLMGTFVVLLGLGAAYQAVSTAIDRRRYRPPGKLIDVGGYRLYLRSEGDAGGPTVVLESGSTMPSILWEPVLSDVAKFARVCTYDRAGYGWSDSVSSTRSGQQVVEDLHTLLHNAGIPGPYILVGHSLGGMYTRLFASRFPSQVAGVVLVDALDEALRSKYPPKLRKHDAKSRWALVFLSRFGIMRVVLKRKPGILDGGKGEWLARFPEALHPGITGVMYHPRLTQAAAREWDHIDAVEREVRAAGNLGDRPLMVLSRGRSDLEGWGLSPDVREAIWTAIKERQSALVGLSPRAKQRIVKNSGHLIYVERPDVVVEAIREVLLEVLRPS